MLCQVRALHVRMELEGEARRRDTQMAEELAEQVEALLTLTLTQP